MIAGLDFEVSDLRSAAALEMQEKDSNVGRRHEVSGGTTES